MLKYLYLTLLTLLSGIATAQFLRSNASYPTPTAASFGLFTEVPVSPYTGTPNIEIPIHEVTEGNIKVPIRLRYHPASVRVHSHPGWVGLGWSLDCGGVITRKMNGKIDEYTFKNDPNDPGSGFYATYAKLAGTDAEWLSTDRLRQYAQDYLPGAYAKLESMPDEFTFSFLGYTGKFFMGHDGLWKVISDDDIKIEFDPTWGQGFIKEAGLPARILDRINACCTAERVSFSDRYFNKFTLITPDGSRYEFGGSSTSVEYSIPYRLQRWAFPTPVSWYLTKITDANGKSISFEYQEGNIVSAFSRTFFASSSSMSGGGIWGPECAAGDNVIFEAPFDGNLIFSVYLSRIASPKGNVTFDRSQTVEHRWPSDAIIDNDIALSTAPVYLEPLTATGQYDSYGEQIQWAKLDRIRIFDYRSEQYFYKQYALTYTNSGDTRLKLLKVQESTSDNKVRPPYLLFYNTTKLPPYSANRAHDHWDFYNGNAQFPALNLPLPQFDKEFTIARAPDASGVAMRAEVLERIQYPTGGGVQFDYEPHVYSKVVNRESNYSFPYSTIENATAGGLRIRRIRFYDESSDVDPVLSKEYYYVTGYRYGENPELLSSSGILAGAPKYYWPNYTAKAYNGVTFSYTVFSSGAVRPYGYNVSGSHIGYSEVTEVSTDRNGVSNGYKRYHFSNFDGDVWGESHYDEIGKTFDPARSSYSPYSSREQERGKLLQEAVYENSNQPVRITKYRYVASSAEYVRQVLQDPLDICAGVNAGAQVCFVTAFKMYAYKFNLAYKQEISYASGRISTNTTRYWYNRHNILNRTSFQSSNGDVIETNLTFPSDYTQGLTFTVGDDGSLALKELVGKHIVNAPVEVMKTRAGKLLESSLTEYKIFSGRIFPYKQWKTELEKSIAVGSAISSSAGNQTGVFNPSGLVVSGSSASLGKDEYYSPQPTTVNRYDDYGNYLEVQEPDRQVVSYIWGYGNTFPVAKIRGISYQEIENACVALSIPISSLNSYLQENDFRLKMKMLRDYLSNAKMESSTFSLHGVTSFTDENGQTVFYEYDTLGRLLNVKNNAGDIVKAYTYHQTGE